MSKYTFIILLVFTRCVTAVAQSSQDSLKSHKASLEFKVNSTGVFPYSGSLENLHTNVTASFLYNTKTWSFFFEKSVDLQDAGTGLNYACAGFYREFAVTKKFSFTPSIGYAASQAIKLTGTSPEVDLIAVASYKISKKVLLENTTMFSDVVERCGPQALYNRLKITYRAKIFDLNLFMWNCPPLWNNTNRFSISPEIVFKNLKIAKHLCLLASAGYYKMLVTGKTSNIKNSFIFTLTVPVNL